VGTRAGGLFYLQAEKLDHADELDDAAVFALHADSDGGLWIGLCNRGLFCLKDGRAQHWKMAQGLPDDTVYAILEDAAGVLWMSCNEGIYGLSKTALLRFDPAAGTPLLPRQLTREDGLLDSACLASGQPAAARSDDGRLPRHPSIRRASANGLSRAGLSIDRQRRAITSRCEHCQPF